MYYLAKSDILFWGFWDDDQLLIREFFGDYYWFYRNWEILIWESDYFGVFGYYYYGFLVLELASELKKLVVFFETLMEFLQLIVCCMFQIFGF